jgi:hypothetical protein
MQTDSRKPRRARVATGIYQQDGALFANYREPGTSRSRFAKLRATTLRAANAERASILAALLRLRSRLAKNDRTRVPVKTEAGKRDLPMLPALRRRLIAHRLASPWTRPGDPVIAATNGKPMAYRNVRRALETISDELGVDLVSHDFRRSLASFPIIAARRRRRRHWRDGPLEHRRHPAPVRGRLARGRGAERDRAPTARRRWSRSTFRLWSSHVSICATSRRRQSCWSFSDGRIGSRPS